MADRRQLELMVEAKRRGLDVSGANASLPEPGASFAEGAAQTALQGATLGFSDEIQSVIAATIAAPFVSDKTFSQLMVDARNSFRETQDQFSEENPKTALALEIGAGAATGGVGALAAKQAGKTLTATGAKQIAATGAGVGAVAGAGNADAEDLVSLETVGDSLVGATAGAALSILTPAVIKTAAKAGSLIPESVPQKLLETALKFRPSIPQAQREAMTKTALSEGIAPSVKGLRKITEKLGVLNDKIDDIIDTATERGVEIPKKALFAQLKGLRQKVGGAKLDARRDVRVINAVVKEFDEQLKSIDKTKLTPREVQELKKAAYERINFEMTQGSASFAKNEARKTIARGAKEALEEIDPEIQPTNKSIGDLIELRDELERVVSRLDNRNLISLDTAAKVGSGGAAGQEAGATIGAAASFLGAPRVKAHTALVLENLRVTAQSLSEAKASLPPALAGVMGVLAGNFEEQLRALTDD